ncbi:hypothetical protein [uncultured Desulfuromonas sp.]|uniref:hypothetical protein n=1 Tax=uncultured Desulfuromonas sp. TaxID=181013 RepID=UPI002AAB402B|nr:hypothetical protein [uncultured Desulfuromonas sp.]
MQHTRNILMITLLLLIIWLPTAGAATLHDEESFIILGKIAVDRSRTDVHAVIEEVAEAIKDEFQHNTCYTLAPISAEENMEGLDVVEIVHFPTVTIEGQQEYAALVELWSNKDDDYLERLSPKYGVNAPWAVSIYSVSAPTLRMLSVAHPEISLDGHEDQLTDYVVVAALNPLAVSKVGYADLGGFQNTLFNAHCSSVATQIKWGVTNALNYETNYDWDMGTQSFFWWIPQFDIADLLKGLAITNDDVDTMPVSETMPSITIPNANAEDVAAALKSYMQATMPMYKSDGAMFNFSALVQEFMAQLFSWDGQTPFDESYDNPMYDPANPMTGEPLIDVYFEDVAEMKAQLPSLLNQFFVPVWSGQTPAGMPLMTQGWKFPRAFALGHQDEVQIVELCTMFYANMALGTGLNHTPAMPCMAAIYQDDDAAVAQMFTAKTTFGAFFKDSVTAMGTMNMEVQTYLFALFPEVIYNDVAALYNGAFQQAGIDQRFEIRPF